MKRLILSLGLPILDRFRNLIAKCKGKTLVPNIVSLDSVIVPLLNLAQFLPSLSFLAIQMPEYFSVGQNDHDRCCTDRYKNLVAGAIVWLVLFSVDLLFF